MKIIVIIIPGVTEGFIQLCSHISETYWQMFPLKKDECFVGFKWNCKCWLTQIHLAQKDWRKAASEDKTLRKGARPVTHLHIQYLLQHFKAQRFLGVGVDSASSLHRIPLQHQLEQRFHWLQQCPKWQPLKHGVQTLATHRLFYLTT